MLCNADFCNIGVCLPKPNFDTANSAVKSQKCVQSSLALFSQLPKKNPRFYGSVLNTFNPSLQWLMWHFTAVLPHWLVPPTPPRASCSASPIFVLTRTPCCYIKHYFFFLQGKWMGSVKQVILKCILTSRSAFEKLIST